MSTTPGRRRAALRAHAPQIRSDSFMVSLPDEAVGSAFGTGWFIRRGRPASDPPAAERLAVLESRSDPAAEL